MAESAQSEAITNIIMACDESGSKGYADPDEACPGEVGVFAGILVPADALNAIAPCFDAVVRRFATNEGKLHVTDLPPEKQEALRSEMFNLIKAHKLPCFYEAIHVAGFHQAHREVNELVDRARAARQSPIKLSRNRPAPSSLHVALFQGLYGKVIAFCLERGKTRLHLEVRTDRVDLPLVRDFESVARELLDFGAKIERATGFDPQSKRVIEGSVTTAATASAFDIPVTIEHLEINVVEDSDGLVVAADILANSLLYHFQSRSPEQRFRALNTPEAFESHPLRDCLDSFERWDGYNFSDSFYAHPSDPELSNG